MTTTSEARALPEGEQRKLEDNKEFFAAFKDCATLLVRKSDQMVIAVSSGDDYGQLLSVVREDAHKRGIEFDESDHIYFFGPATFRHAAKVLAEQDETGKKTLEGP